MKTLSFRLMTLLSIFAIAAFASCGKDKGGDNNGNDGGTGSTEISFTEFSPLVGEAGTKFYIIGENFGTDISNVKVWLGDTELTVTEIRNQVRMDITLPQIMGGIYSVKAKVGDKEYTFDKKFTCLLAFSEVSTYAGTGTAGADNGAPATATFYKPFTIVYDKRDDALFVHEDPEAGGKKLRRIKGGQVETLIDYTVGSVIPNNIRSAVFSVSGDTLFLANDNGNNRDNGSVFIATRADDFKSLSLLVGSNTANPGLQTDAAHFNFAGVNPVTGTLYMYSWLKKLYVWDKTGNSVNQVYNFGTKLGTGDGDYSSIAFSLDGDKIYLVGRNDYSKILVADYNVAQDRIDGEFSDFAGNGQRGCADGTGVDAILGEPFHSMSGADGYLYVPEIQSRVIRRISPEGKAVTIAGMNSAEAGASNGAPLQSTFNGPTSVAFDSENNMYVADFYNNKIRKLTVIK